MRARARPGRDQDAHGATQLFIEAEKWHAAVTKQLLAARCNVDLQMKNGCTPFHDDNLLQEIAADSAMKARC